MHTPLQYTFTTFAFLGFILACIPFPWHFRSRNTGTCLYMGWVGLACLNFFINSIIWADNAVNWAPVWCDISARIIVALEVAIHISSLCINRRLCIIASCQTVHETKAQKRRNMIVDLSLGIGGPFLIMCLQYFLQGHRFNIIEEYGCSPHIYNVWFAYPLFFMWPIIIGLISLRYCIKAIYHLRRRHSQFKEFLASNNSGINRNGYIRLMCLAGIDAVLTVPISTYFLIRNAMVAIHYPGWASQHLFFSRVDQFPAITWRRKPYMVLTIELVRWTPIICAFIFFALFGFAEEARKHYHLAYLSVTKRLRNSRGTITAGASTGMQSKSFPVTSYDFKNPAIVISKETSSRCDSFGSFNLTIADVGNTLDDYKPPLYSATASPGGSSPYSNSTISLPADDNTPEAPAITRPEPVLDIANITRRSAESSPVRLSSTDSLQLGDVV